MWKISKEFNLEFGHRVHTQSLNKDYCAAGDTKCACRHLHGHSGILTLTLEGDVVDERGMLCDFKEMGWLKDFVDNNLDHKFIIDRYDPLFHTLIPDMVLEKDCIYSPICVENYDGNAHIAGWVVALDKLKIHQDTPLYELLEGYFIVDFVPTSENLSKWIYDIATFKMSPLGVKITEVSWKETAKSCARYYGS